MMSVVVPSVRSNTVGHTVSAILEQTDADWELIVSDQSGTDALVPILERFADPRVRRVICPGRGASQARNFGVLHAACDIIAFTDDDCRPRPDWLATIRQLFSGEPDLWMATGSLVAPPVKLPLLHTGTYVPQERRARPSDGGERIYSVTANAAYRRVAFEKAGPFDVCLSPGTEFCGGEEGDHGDRMEMFDPILLQTPRLEVEHTYGLRTGFKEVWALRRNYAISVGAAAGKRTLLYGDGRRLVWHETNAALKCAFRRSPMNTVRSLARAYYVWKAYRHLLGHYNVERQKHLLVPHGEVVG